MLLSLSKLYRGTSVLIGNCEISCGLKVVLVTRPNASYVNCVWLLLAWVTLVRLRVPQDKTRTVHEKREGCGTRPNRGSKSLRSGLVFFQWGGGVAAAAEFLEVEAGVGDAHDAVASEDGFSFGDNVDVAGIGGEEGAAA